MSSKNKHEKKVNVINRTTSETLRLGGESDLRVLTQTSLRQEPAPISRKKIQNSSSSFQITGVSLTRSDIGDDSADDLDESHTDDISRVTDNETPSFSEDSRDTDDHQVFDLPCAPIVLTEPQLTISKKMENQLYKPPDEDTGARFKVVKLANSSPYSRGRWTCRDYLDSTETVKQNTYPKQTFIHLDKQVVSNLPSQASHVQGKYPHHCCPRPNLAVESVPKIFSEKPLRTDISPHYLCRDGKPPGFVNTPQDVSTTSEPAIEKETAILQGSVQDDLWDIKVALTATPSTISAISGSAPNNNNIDRKIEEALDAVKTHLMVAVHKEVDFLKTRVSTLEGRVNELEIENSILRVNYLLFKS